MSALFQEACLEEPTRFIVLCTLTEEPPTSHNLAILYEYVAILRTLPKPFHLTLDTTRASLTSYLLHLPRIVTELTRVGRCRCLRLDIIVHDQFGVMSLLQNMINGLTFEDTQGCDIQLRHPTD